MEMRGRGLFGLTGKKPLTLVYLLAVGLFASLLFLYSSCGGSSSWTRNQSSSPISGPLVGFRSEGDTVSRFRFHDKLSRSWFLSHCLNSGSVSRSISDIYGTFKSLEKIADSPNLEQRCGLIKTIFDNLLEFDKIETSIFLPPTFQTQVRNWLGNNDTLFQEVYTQNIFKVVSKVSGEETLFNTLRSKRPVSSSGIDPTTYIEDLVRKTKKTCDFCSYQNHTGADLFGRIQSEYSATASNTFKLAKFHGLFFPLSHHPVNLTYEQLHDLFVVTSQKWFEKVYETDPTQNYPSLLWDSLPHAGASQVHPHVHGLVDNKQYAGIFETIHKNSKKYFESVGRSLWTDFILLHQVLGLSKREGNAVVLVPITARKDHEFWIISNELDENVIKLLYRVLLAYRQKLNTFCHSSGIAYPLLGKFNPGEGLPVIFRIGSRGDCTVLRSDVSSLELYTVNNINSNLEETISALESIK